MGNFFSSILNDTPVNTTLTSRVLVRSDGSVSNLFPVCRDMILSLLAVDVLPGRMAHGQLRVNRWGCGSICSQRDANNTQ